MRRVLIYVDIDGTLRCNHVPDCRDPNERIVELVKILAHMKNIVVCAWSGGGKEYAEQWVRIFGLNDYITDCFSKLDTTLRKPDIAIDDQQEFNMGLLNLIVREK
jgi:hypothetical protein